MPDPTVAPRIGPPNVALSAATSTESAVTSLELVVKRRVVSAFRVSGSPVHVLAVCDDGTVWDCIVHSSGEPSDWHQCAKPIPEA